MAWYHQMVAIRTFEEKVMELYLQGLVEGTTHLCIGQEAVAVGAVAALRSDDYLTITYRGHGQALARGLAPERAFAELMGRRTGSSGGLGGSMHLIDLDRGLLGSFAIVGAGLPAAVGAALSARLRGSDQAALTFCGDGAVNIGTFHEALNMAAVWRVPLVVVIENNAYGEFTPYRAVTSVEDLAERAHGYAIPGHIVDGQDVEAVHEVTAAALDRARAGEGPSLIEAKTYRYRGHSRTDPGRYRPPGELEAWQRRDPIEILAQRLVAEGVLGEDEAAEIRASSVQAMDAAADRAAAGPFPTLEEAAASVYASEPAPAPPAAPAAEASEMTYREAIRAALADALAADPAVVFLGEDVGAAGGPFKTSEGLLERFGRDRVIDTPICENGFVGVALGLALTGFRPVVEIMFSDFLPTAGDAIVNELPKFRFMSGGRARVPVTVRAIGGATGRFGAQHSATGESWFLGLPGLRIAAAATPGSAYGLLRTAIEDPNPTLVFEHKGLYSVRGPVDPGTRSAIGKAEILRPGRDATVVATLLMVHRSLDAAAALAEEGVEAEVIDLRWLNPLDLDTVRASVARTGRLVVVEEQPHAGGWGATIISEVIQAGPGLTAAPRVVSMPDIPVPFSPPLEDRVLPSVESIVAAVRSVARG